MAQLTAKLIAGHGMEAIALKVEKYETYNGAKHRDVDQWLFQPEEHISLTRIPTNSQVAHAASLLRGNVAMWRWELCEGSNRLDAWGAFKTKMRAQFCMDNLIKRARDALYAL